MSQNLMSPPATTEDWENEGGSLRTPPYAESLGVTRVQVETFKVGGYTYTNLADAVAQGRRLQKQGFTALSLHP
jgi:hypothetical protein